MYERTKILTFRFMGDQLQHVKSGKYAHPILGRKGLRVFIEADNFLTFYHQHVEIEAIIYVKKNVDSF